jgi:hypothetical protein
MNLDDFCEFFENHGLLFLALFICAILFMVIIINTPPDDSGYSMSY